MTETEQLDAVRALVAAGLSVIPLPRPDADHDGKVPTIPWKDYQGRHATDDELQGWFNGELRNLAVVTGAISGICVVDADSAGAEAWLNANLPLTPWRVRTARGVHWYYRHPGGRVANRVHAEVPGGTLDLRGDGGYVVGPGSVHATGATYTPEGDWDVPRVDLPVLPMDALPAPRRRPETRLPAQAPRDTPARVLERARAYAATCDPAVQGQGGDTQTFLVCCRIARGFDLGEQDAVTVLRAWNARCAPPWTEEQLAAKVRNALRYGDEPLGGRRDEPGPAPTSPPLRLEGHELTPLHPDHPDAEKEPQAGAQAAQASTGPRPWIEPASEFLARVDAPERWLVNELLPAGVLALVHGEPRARKSWFALELAVALCTGTQAFGLARFAVPEAVPVLYSSQEDAASRVRKRAQRFLRGRGITGAPRGLYFSVHAGIDLEDAVWQEVLIKDCREFGIKAVILDPIRRYSPNVDKGPAEVRAVTMFLRRLSVEAACSVIIVHHDVKPLRGREEDTRRRGHRASGGDWFAACEAPIHVEKINDDASLVVPEDYKFSEDPDSFVFKIIGKSEDPTVRVVAETTSAADAKLLTTQEKVLEYLGEHPGATQNAIIRACKIGRSTLPEVLSSLERAGQVDSAEGPRNATIWFLTTVSRCL